MRSGSRVKHGILAGDTYVRIILCGVFFYAIVSPLALGQTSAPADAQAHAHAGHSQPAVDHSVMNQDEMDHEEMQHEEMNHDEMSNEQTTEPTSTRSPHAYSNGYTREQGPYALPAVQQLHLADEKSFNRLLMNRLELLDSNGHGTNRFDIQAWFGTTYDHLVIKTEGEVSDGSLDDSKTELLWSHAVTPFWDTQIGLRIDNGDGPARSWLAAGVQGLAPYWFDVHATAFVGESGRTAFSFEAEYEGRISQRLIVKPRIDFNFYGKSDLQRGIGRGFSNAILGLRLQYQFTRQIAPYIGVESVRKFGETAELLGPGFDRHETRWLAGIRFWY